jgi:hypothetical protein
VPRRPKATPLATFPGRCLPLGLPQHTDEHRRKRPIPLAIDEELGEGAALWMAPELTDPLARSKSGTMRTWGSSARGAGSRASSRSRSACSISGSDGI